jgi:transposase-like protein
MLDRWLRQFAVHGEDSFQGQAWRSAALSAQERIDQLEEELRLARMEVSLVRRMLDEKKSGPGSGPR